MASYLPEKDPRFLTDASDPGLASLNLQTELLDNDPVARADASGVRLPPAEAPEDDEMPLSLAPNRMPASRPMSGLLGDAEWTHALQNATESEPYKQAEAGLKRNEDLLNLMGQHSPDPQMDLSPFYATANALTGMTSKNAPQLGAPTPPTDIRKNAQDLLAASDKLQGNRQSLLKDATAAAQAQKSNAMMAQQLGLERLAMQQNRFGEMQNQNATKAGQAFEHDPMIIQFKKTGENLNRAESLLNGTTPITATSFNDIQNDFINALSPGGAATEGKINRELVETAYGAINKIKQHFGNVSDLRKEQPEIVENLRALMARVHQDYNEGMARQAMDIHDSFANSTNPMVQKTIKDKLGRYSPEAHLMRYGTEYKSPYGAKPAATTSAPPKTAPGTPVTYQGVKYKIGADGDTLEPL
jgi:hypothetical protein